MSRHVWPIQPEEMELWASTHDQRRRSGRRSAVPPITARCARRDYSEKQLVL